MAVFVKYTSAIDHIVKAANLGTDTFKVALATTVNAADTTFTAGTSDLATGNGYTAGGNSATVSSATTTAGTFSLTLANPATWTASGAGLTFRYAILYNATGNVPYGYYDYGSSLTLNGANAETFTVTFSGAALTATMA